MKKQILIALTALAVAALACAPIQINIPRITPGPTETFTVNEPLPEGDTAADVELNMGGGEFVLAGGAEGLLEGEVTYNVADWKPTLTRQGERLVVQQGESTLVGIPDGHVINKWDLRLGDAPMELTIHAGAYQGEIDLSGVPLRSLTINDGASNSEVRFDSPNPEEMESLTYASGASSVRVRPITRPASTNPSFGETKPWAIPYAPVYPPPPLPARAPASRRTPRAVTNSLSRVSNTSATRPTASVSSASGGGTVRFRIGPPK